MRRIVMFNRVTADGYFAGPDGSSQWMVPAEELDAQVAQGLEQDLAKGGPSDDTILFGRRTYEMFAGFWPQAVKAGGRGPAPHAAGPLSQEQRAMGLWLNQATKVVFSKKLKDATWANSRVVREVDARAIEAMKSRPGKDMLIFGSGSIVSQLTQLGLIDEYRLVVSPLFLGSGRSLIEGLSASRRLELLEAKSYRSGNVVLRYALAG